MSKLAQELRWAQGVQRRPVDQPISVMVASAEWRPDDVLCADEHTLGVKLACRVFVSKQELERSHEFVIKDARRQIVEEVFGEFRGPLNEVERAIWERNWTAATEAVRRVRAQMFED